MEKVSAVEAVKRQFERCFAEDPDQWQVTTGEAMTLEEFLSGTPLRLPAAFFSYGGFVAVDETITASGICHRYERTVIVYLMQMGDMYPAAEAFRLWMNTAPNNRFKDLDSEHRTIIMRSGDGTRMAMEGFPAFEITFSV